MADREYAGAIHIHTRFSDGATPAAEVVALAEKVGLDFVIICDHNSTGVQQAGLTGWHGRTLCLCAPEIGKRRHPHFIALGLRNPAPLAALSPPEGLQECARRGLRTFVAHPHVGQLRGYPRKPVDWPHWDAAITGMEIWSYMHDVVHKVIPWRLPLLFLNHRWLVRGPRRETLKMWDQLGRSRRVAGIGSLDNHATVFFSLFRIFPHQDLFRMLRTHVICAALPQDGPAAEEILVKALGEGSCFVALDGWADATGFRFCAQGPGPTLGMGQETAYAAGWKLIVESPRAAELTIVRDGSPLAKVEKARALEAAVEGPGVYRVEARLGGRPWVYTNPIYFRG
jgi:hypothetical protein